MITRAANSSVYFYGTSVNHGQRCGVSSWARACIRFPSRVHVVYFFVYSSSRGRFIYTSRGCPTIVVRPLEVCGVPKRGVYSACACAVLACVIKNVIFITTDNNMFVFATTKKKNNNNKTSKRFAKKIIINAEKRHNWQSSVSRFVDRAYT